MTSDTRHGPGTYEATVTHPDGPSTVARVARTASRQGYDGVVVRTPDAEYDRERIEDRYGIDVVDGIEIRGDDRAAVAGHLGNVRSGSRTDYTVVAVEGGTRDLNRFAVEQDRVDVLARPIAAGDGYGSEIGRAHV